MSANNSCHLIGRLTKDIEIRKTTTGKTVTQFTLAVYRDKENTDYVSCVAWNKLAELLYNKFGKGDEFAVDGRLQTRKYDQNGITHYVTELVAESMAFTHGSKRSDESRLEKTVQGFQALSYQPQTNENERDGLDISDEFLPF